MPAAKGIKRQLGKAMENVNAEIARNAKPGGVASGLASEGYAGGYAAALRDVSLALNGIDIWQSRYWPAPRDED